MNILTYPDKILLEKTHGWDFSISRIPDLYVEDMERVLEESHTGVALAANQVGIPYSFFVIRKNFAETHELPRVVANPIIVEKSIITEQLKEGCLSFPGHFLSITRPRSVKIMYQDVEGGTHVEWFDGFNARLFLHEIEHLDGETFLKNVNSTVRRRIAKSVILENM